MQKKSDLDDADFYDDLFPATGMPSKKDPSSMKKKGKGKSLDDDDDDDISLTDDLDAVYILGTLIVRVVAARDLPPASNHHGGGGLGDFLFGGGKGGSANPYASVNFGNSTQRTSTLHDTRDPVWPRGESMFMDVALPLAEATHPNTTIKKKNKVNPESTATSTSSEAALETPMLHDTTTQSATAATHKNLSDGCASLNVPHPVLTVALFSADDNHHNNSKYNPSKGLAGDSDDEFLGVVSMDLTPLVTGKRSMVDSWLPLTAASGSIRVICEYEPTDVAPRMGDKVQFTRFCHPADLFPLVPAEVYVVQGVVDDDRILLSYTSQEGWICSFVCHKNMVLCVDRKHHNAVEVAKEEWQSITERLSHSPLVGTVQKAVEKLPEEGILAIGGTALQGGASLLNRWLEHGLDTAVKDVAFATNWDGRFNPGGDMDGDEDGDDMPQVVPNNSHSFDSSHPEGTSDASAMPTRQASYSAASVPSAASSSNSNSSEAALPGMPCCPITGEPMIDPVVAADGHTYERAAIERWLQASDKSPLTGSILPHKQLVPNYGLLSSLREQAELNHQHQQQQQQSTDSTTSAPAEAPDVGGVD